VAASTAATSCMGANGAESPARENPDFSVGQVPGSGSVVRVQIADLHNAFPAAQPDTLSC
jgi:hypothetical protein